MTLRSGVLPWSSSMRRALAFFGTTALVGALCLHAAPDSVASPASSAAVLVDAGKAREVAGDELGALARYHDALTIDPTSSAAYLALGALRVKRNELLEAEQVYTQGVQRVPGSIPLRLGRARIHRLREHWFEAAEDVRIAHAMTAFDGSDNEVTVLREAAAVFRAARWNAPEIAIWRRLWSIGIARQDAALSKEASIQARALGLFMGELDPVLAGKAGTDLRRSFAAIVRRP